MLEIYKRDEFNGKLKILATFNSFEDLFRRVGYRYNFAETFGYDDTDRHSHGHDHFGDHGRTPSIPRRTDYLTWGWKETQYRYIAFEDGKVITPDRLVGLYRDYAYNNRIDWHKRWNRKADRGQKKSAYGGLRRIRTFHERRWAHAWDDEEFAPRVRAARQGHNLPDPWDDYWADNQKSWKRQSKRKHQWKEK